MATNWKEVKRKSADTPERRARTAARQQAMRDAMALGEIREKRELTQTDVAKVMEISQGRVSRLERSQDVYLSTLREYVEALGGRLEVAAVFDEDGDRVLIGA